MGTEWGMRSKGAMNYFYRINSICLAHYAIQSVVLSCRTTKNHCYYQLVYNKDRPGYPNSSLRKKNTYTYKSGKAQSCRLHNSYVAII